MDGVRSVLLLTGPHDVGGVGTSAVEVAARLASAHLIHPMIAGTCRPLLRHARERGLSAIDLSSLPPSNRRAWLDATVSSVHIVHALGMAAADAVLPDAADALLPVVVTFDGTHVVGRLRARRVRRRRSPTPVAPTRWLVHGQLASARLVRSGLTHADDVMTLPLLPTVASSGPDWAAARAAARQRLSLPPGTRVVIGSGPAGNLLRRLDAALARASVHAVGYWLKEGGQVRWPGRASARITVVDAAAGGSLLPAMDVLVCGGTAFGALHPAAALHPAVDAVRAGVPVITGPADPAAELVQHGVNGFVCAPGDLPFALDAAFAMVAGHGLRGTAAQTAVQTAAQIQSAEEVTARCYSAVLERPLVRPVLIGRRAAR